MIKAQLTQLNELVKKIDFLKEHINKVNTLKVPVSSGEKFHIRLVDGHGKAEPLLDDCFYKDEFMEMYLLRCLNLLDKLQKEFDAI